MIRRLKAQIGHFAVQNDGVGTALSLFMLITILLIGSISVDYANAIRAQSRLQAFADAVAMSAGMHLPDSVLALESARNAAAANLGDVAESAGDIAMRDVQLGNWNFESKTFVQSASSPNAVRVIARNATANGNPLNTLLLRLVGIDRLEVSAAAVVLRPELPRCSGGGYFSRERISVVNSNYFRRGFCVHGDQGVTLNNVNYFERGTTIGMHNLSNFIQFKNNEGAAEALRRNRHRFALLDSMPTMIDAMQLGDLGAANLPHYITTGPVYLNHVNSNTDLESGTFYIVNGNVNFGSNITVENVAIVTTGTIRANSNTVLRNVVLASEGAITLNSNNFIGDTSQNYCSAGGYSTYLFTLRDITFNTNNTVRGVMMLASGAIDTGNNNDSTDGIYAEAGREITLGNANSTDGCPDGLRRAVGEENLGEISVSLVF